MSLLSDIGFRFHPTEEELINFLKGFVTGQPLSSHGVIQVGEVYGHLEPWKIFGTGDRVRHFYSPLKRQKNSKIRFSRTVGQGTWKGQNKGQSVKDRKGNVVGFRRNLKFHSDAEPHENNKWIMKEYYLGDDFLKNHHIVNQDFVVCRIKNKEKDDLVLEKDFHELMEEEVDDVISAMLRHGKNTGDNITVDKQMQNHHGPEEDTGSTGVVADNYVEYLNNYLSESDDDINNVQYSLTSPSEGNSGLIYEMNEVSITGEVSTNTFSSSELEVEAFGQDWDNIDQQSHGISIDYSSMIETLKGIGVDRFGNICFSEQADAYGQTGQPLACVQQHWCHGADYHL